MKTAIYEADPFTNAKTNHFVTPDCEFRFEPRNEFFLTTEKGQRFKVRVTHMRLDVTRSGLSRELIAMKL